MWFQGLVWNQFDPVSLFDCIRPFRSFEQQGSKQQAAICTKPIFSVQPFLKVCAFFLFFPFLFSFWFQMLSKWANAARSSWEKASRHPWLWHCYPIDTPYIFGTLQQTHWQPQDWWKGKEAVLQSKENVLKFLRPFERMPEWYWISAFLSSFKMMQQVVFSTCDDVFQDKSFFKIFQACGLLILFQITEMIAYWGELWLV